MEGAGPEVLGELSRKKGEGGLFFSLGPRWSPPVHLHFGSLIIILLYPNIDSHPPLKRVLLPLTTGHHPPL